MPKFMFIYHGGSAPETPEEIDRVMAAWTAWFKGMGEAVVDMGNPAGLSKTVSAEGVANHGGANPVSGYSLVTAADEAAAIALARCCPIIADGGSVEVAQAMEM